MTERKRLTIALIVAVAVFAVEFAGSFLARSVALLADSFHVLTDSLSLGIALWAVIAALRPPTARESFGYAKAKSSLAPFANGLCLIILGIMALLRVAEKFLADAERVVLLPLLVGAGVGLLGNVAALLVLRRGAPSENLRAAIAHVLSDTATSVAVIGSGALVAATGRHFWDGVFGGLIALWMLGNGWRIIRRAAPELLDIAPRDFPVERLAASVLATPGVLRIEHRPHLTMSGGRLTLTLHLIVKPERDPGTIYRLLHDLLEREFSIRHSTIQLETGDGDCRTCIFET